MSPPPASALPYADTKPQGAADFCYAINATFRFILRRFGPDGWRRHLEEMGRGYFGPVNRSWHESGLPAIARCWRAFFASEPGTRVEVVEKTDRVEGRVHECPAIKPLRAGGREIVREYCQHCFILGNARAEAARFTMRLTGSNGSRRQIFATPTAALEPPAPGQIAEAR